MNTFGGGRAPGGRWSLEAAFERAPRARDCALKGMVIFLIDRFKEFIDLLQQHGAKSAMSLLLIPGTTLRAPEASYDPGQSFHFFHPLQIRDENCIRRV